MIKKLAVRFFDIRTGEFQIAFLMFLYIFFVIAVLLIVKPTVNALFLSELGPEQLPFGYILVALGAVGSSLLYSKSLHKYHLKSVIRATLTTSAIILVTLAIFAFTDLLRGWMLYFYYTWVAIYGLLSASQFWVMANLLFSVRDAKRLFGFIGSGGILGGLFGGYLTSLFAPLLGNEFMILLASMMLAVVVSLLDKIWKAQVNEDAVQKTEVSTTKDSVNPFHLVKQSTHLTNLALLVGIGVLVAKLVDYLFSDYAASNISDPDELSSFFGFWLSTFSLVSLGIQLFLTQRIVGVWGVGFSLLLLPLGILLGSIFFLFFPELSVVVFIKAMDGTFKQSINKSASELLALPLPFDLKNKTKSFIDVVVDSWATGIAGLILLFFIKGFEWQSIQIAWLIIALVSGWAFLVFRVRNSYYETFRNNLQGISGADTTGSTKMKKVSVVEGMRNVFANGSEKQILFMLNKLMEINDQRFAEDVRNLLEHPSIQVKTAAVKNLYYLDNSSMPSNIKGLLEIGDQALNLAVMDLLLLHTRNEPDFIFDQYLDDPDTKIADAALYALAKESAFNQDLLVRYGLEKRLLQRIARQPEPSTILLNAIGVSRIKKLQYILSEAFSSDDPRQRHAAITAMGLSKDVCFLEMMLGVLHHKDLRPAIVASLSRYGSSILPHITTIVRQRKVSVEACRFVPKLMETYGDAVAVRYLFELFEDVDLSIRTEVVRSLSNIRRRKPDLKFNRFKIANKILEECKLYHQTMSAMHTQIIISFRNRKKSKSEVLPDERDARSSLLDLLDRRLDAGLERIFRLLGLKFPQQDVLLAYDRLVGNKEEERAKAIDFLDNLLTGNLKQQVFPIIEETALDFSNEEAIQRIIRKVPGEQKCFELLLAQNDVKLQLAVLYLIGKQREKSFRPLLNELSKHPNEKIRSFALKAIHEIES